MPQFPTVPKLRLRTTLVIPFILQIVVTVGLVGYLSFRNGQKAVTDLATQLSAQASDRVRQQLSSYLAIPLQVSRVNVQAIALGILNPVDQETTTRFLWEQMKVFKNLSYINVGTEAGAFLGVGREDNGLLYVEQMLPNDRFKYQRYALDNEGKPRQWLATEVYRFQEDAWYQNAAIAGSPLWSSIYQWSDRPEILSLSASYPLYDAEQRLVGVFGVDLILSQISDFLRTLQVSPAGQVFVIERDGLIVASSSAEPPYRKVQGEAQRLNVLHSQDALIRQTATQLRDRFGSFAQITTPSLLSLRISNDEKAFVSVTPWQDDLGLDWLVVVVIPEADFMTQITANTHNTLWLCGGALILSILIGGGTATRVSRPILQISEAATALAHGDVNQQVPSSHLLEIDRLAIAFNRMAASLKHSITALRQSKARHQAILNAIPDLILRIHEDGTYLDVEPAKGINLVATSTEWIIGKRLDEVLPLDLAEQYLQAIRVAIQSREIQIFEHRLQVGDKEREYEVRVVCSGPAEAIVILRDISDRQTALRDRQQAEAKLLASEERYRSLVANIPGAIYRCRVDSEWTMEYLTDAITSISGYPATDFIENRVHSYASIIHPEDRALVDIVTNHALVTKEPFVLEYRILHRDGSIRWVHEQGRGVFDSDNHPLYLDGVIFDITERKQAERSLRHSEATNRALVAAIPDLLLRVNREGKYLSNAIGANRLQAISGGTSELAGSTVWDSLPPDLAQLRMQAIEQALATGSLQVYEQCLTPHDRIIYEEVRVAVMGEDEVLVMVRDISDRKRAEEALRLANEELEQRVEARTAELRKEKERSEKLLLNILPAEIVERLKQADASPAEHFEEATILFADIVGFTNLATKLEPMQLVDGLNQIFSAFDQLTEKYNLEKIKTIGDAYMVVGGLPTPRPDHAFAIADMALDMQAHMRNLDSILGDSLQLRIGINTGPVIAGVIGIKKFIYDLWGDAVNIASRMESQGKPGHIQVTEATYMCLRDRYILEPRGSVPIKGRGEMMTYWLLGRRCPNGDATQPEAG
ncbi:adenylate/guanylate cyclase domain-containing protein [Trichothermofontia sp.]